MSSNLGSDHRARLNCSMWITDKPAILNRWADHFSAVLNRPADINTEAIARLSQVETNTDFDRPHSEEEVKKAIKQLSTGKAPGADSIPAAEVYKHSGDTLLQKLTYVFRRTWDEEVITQQLNYASIICLYKREIASFVTTIQESLSPGHSTGAAQPADSQLGTRPTSRESMRLPRWPWYP